MGNVEGPGIVVIVLVFGVIFIILAGKWFVRSTKKYASEQDPKQMQINKMARSYEEDGWTRVGKSAREAKKRGGCVGWLILIGIIIMALLAMTGECPNIGSLGGGW